MTFLVIKDATKDCSYQLLLVDPEGIDKVWKKVEHLVIKTNDEFLNEKDVYDYLKHGVYRLFLIKEKDKEEIVTAFTVQAILYPRFKTCRIITLGGSKLKQWFHLLKNLEEWAEERNFMYMELYGRRGWVKLMKDYKEAEVLLHKKLNLKKGKL